ncbi:MAG: peptide-binding protein [Epsilonproteobacteria bacterium (ex Lamellibrachia satsuma)]|nr:MAG: peptide-binding protein [Epsilonproteobacteria bacterium (ex Lamellibrachia satsuma)]
MAEKRTSLWLFIVVAFLFSIGLRMYWPLAFGDTMSMYHNGQLMINTNDGYFFATAAKDILNGFVSDDLLRAVAAKNASPGLVYLTVYATKWTPFSLESVILYLPAVISSLIVIPIVLTGRLLGNTLLGFLAALLGAITWSYYNRTMVGYYDTDMFSVLLQFTIFYALLHVIYKKDIFSLVLAAFFILIYPLFYAQGMSIVFATFIFVVSYLFLEHMGWIKQEETKAFSDKAISLYGTVILLSIVLMITVPIGIKVVLFVLAALLILSDKLTEKQLQMIALVAFVSFLWFGNVFSMIWGSVSGYLDRGVAREGLHFYQVVQTVREAGAIPLSTVANRISGSMAGFTLALVGYVLLVIRHKPFIVALPLIGVGLFALMGGLRFTVYAVPVAAISAMYFFFFIAGYMRNRYLKVLLPVLGVIVLLIPNIQHIMAYKVPTVMNAAEVSDLEKLKKISSPRDYTLAWWDYGYPIWFYSDTNTIIDGAKHQNDNFIISKTMQTGSPELAANLGRIAVEHYVTSGYKNIADTLFKNGQKDQLDPNLFLAKLESGGMKLPQKTRDIYLYLPYRMLNIFPTVTVFGNLDLMTGKAERKVQFYPTRAIKDNNGVLQFSNGIVFDMKKGELLFGKRKVPIKSFIVTQITKNGKAQVRSQFYHAEGQHVVVFMESYKQFIVMDTETFKSTYVQMFILGKYDKSLFELVVSSPYSKIYKLKK